MTFSQNLQKKKCGAKTRQGTPCKSAPVKGKNRCRMHGGAKGSGAPKGNQNAYKHGYYTKEMIQFRKLFNGYAQLCEDKNDLMEMKINL